jgi:hypothetical protein
LKSKFNIRYFDLATLVYISVLVVFLFLIWKSESLIPFDTEASARKLEAGNQRRVTDEDRKKDTTFEPKEDLELVWTWKSAKTDKNFSMPFKIKKMDFSRAEKFWSGNENSTSLSDVYLTILREEGTALDQMVSGYKSLARSDGMNYMEVMEMVVSSIQYIPYTWVLSEDGECNKLNGMQYTLLSVPKKFCDIRSNPSGCCDGVKFGVYTPVHFAVRKTADCDTRSLFAYRILKSMGYDVAVMLSKSEAHSVLGVKVPGIPGDGKTGNLNDAKHYFLWELTAFGPELGRSIEGNDWEIAIK